MPKKRQPTEISLTLAHNMRRLRMARGWSQDELAHRSTLHRSYIGDLERGDRNAVVDNIEKVAKALEVTFDQLFVPAGAEKRS